MSTQDDDFFQQLRATFKVEAEEQLQIIATGLLELEKTPAPAAQRRLVETVFHAAHSLKGAARAVNLTEVEALCQSLEDTFSAWKRRQSTPSPAVLDALHRALDAAATCIAAPVTPETASEQAPLPAPVPAVHPSGAAVASAPANNAADAERTAEAEAAPTPGSGTAEKPAVADTVRVAVAKLDARLVDAEEMLAAKLTSGQRAADLGNLVSRFEAWRKEWAKVQPEMRALRPAFEPAGPGRGVVAPPGLSRLMEFCDWNHDYLRSLESEVATLGRAAEHDRIAVGRLVDALLDDSKKLLMLPLSTLGALLPKIVRDLCRDQGKEADLTVRGDDIEIDKRILEEMKDPLIHLLRNCVDHGIESPAERRRLGKPPRAVIALSVSRVNGDKVEILVSDDGAGVDVDKVRESAVKHGVVTAAQAGQLSETEGLALAFQADVSTSPMITHLSGRGLGLAIVREKAEKLGGRVTIESRRHAGTTIRITVPVTLATFRGVLVEAMERLFVVPTSQVERVARFRPADIQTVEGRETLALNGRTVALVHLAEVLELPPVAGAGAPPAATPVVVVSAGDQRVAFAVDAVLGEQEVLVRRLTRPLARVRNIAGATVLGSGQLVPILNVSDLLKSAKRAGAKPARAPAVPKPAAQTRSILVVDDSITSRMLLKGILETAGYRVTTAVDGIDAYTTLRAGRFDLVVSDVDMPRMDGFDLTGRIRADKKLAELPVVLVTALETREHRERGIDAGANAYLVKSSFDQSDLIEAVRRLV